MWSFKLLIAKCSVVFSLMASMQLITNKSSPINSSEETTGPTSSGRRDPVGSTDTAAHGREYLSKDTDLSCTLQESVGCQDIFNMRVGIS